MNHLPGDQWIFIILKPCRFDRVKELKIYFFLMTLMKDKYLLHIINEMKKNGKSLEYSYRCREKNIHDMNISC